MAGRCLPPKIQRPKRPKRALTVAAFLGRAIRDRRVGLDMTQLELSAAAGIHVVVISRIETGQTVPTLPTLEAVAEVLKVRSSELLRRAEELADAESP